ncbi:hypothetical protein [Gluconobacter wancherniae]|uniref:hypothetical protein n=1 Tax=Gluconobacter wancherniae TaxID=1307955 RepID=UPI001B8C2607|nr:hypothetical protein [Gluconobacter wancherniae]MBS1093846.1 hypothetical protein [Gluconobacter wancherniae]
MNFYTKLCKEKCYIFWSLMLITIISCIIVGICTDQSTTCQWISAIGTLVGAIFTAVVGFFAYRIAKEQNHSANTSLGMSVSQEYAKIINRAFEDMFDVSDAKRRDAPEYPEKFGMEYPSNVVTPLILASEVFDEIAGSDLLLRGKLRSLLRKQLNPELIREIENRENFRYLLERELNSPQKRRVLSGDEERIFMKIEEQYELVSRLYSLPSSRFEKNVSDIISEHNTRHR